MSPIVVVVVLLYAIGVTLALLLAYRSQRRPATDMPNWSELLQDAQPTDRAAILSAWAEFLQHHHPWYERAISATGVIAFGAMTLAATVQTIRSSLDEVAAKTLAVEIAKSTERIAEADRVVGALSQVLVGRPASAVLLTPSEESILRYRLTRLRERERASDDERREIIEVAFTLRQYDAVVEAVERWPTLLDDARPADKVTLCEYHYLVGSQGRAKQLLEDLRVRKEPLPIAVRRRIIVMSALLAPEDRLDGLVDELAEAMRTNRTSAKMLLDREVQAFSASARRLTQPFASASESQPPADDRR